MIVVKFKLFGEIFEAYMNKVIAKEHLSKITIKGKTSSQAFHNLVIEIRELGYEILTETELRSRIK